MSTKSRTSASSQSPRRSSAITQVNNGSRDVSPGREVTISRQPSPRSRQGSPRQGSSPSRQRSPRSSARSAITANDTALGAGDVGPRGSSAAGFGTGVVAGTALGVGAGLGAGAALGAGLGTGAVLATAPVSPFAASSPAFLATTAASSGLNASIAEQNLINATSPSFAAGSFQAEGGLPSAQAGAETASFPSEQEMVAEAELENVEMLLASRGYVVINRLLVDVGEDEIFAHYLKAYDKNGNTVYVELDAPGNLMRGEEDQIYAERANLDMIPRSYRTGTLKAVESDVWGAMLECSNGFCSVRQNINDVANPHEHWMVRQDYRDAKIIASATHYMAYPLVRLSEILIDPIHVAKQIDVVSIRIRHVIYQLARESLEITRCEVIRLVEHFNHYITVTEKYLAANNCIRSKLTEYKCAHEAQPCVDEVDVLKYAQILATVHHHYHGLGKLTKSMLKIGSHADDLRHLSHHLHHHAEKFECKAQQIDLIHQIHQL